MESMKESQLMFHDQNKALITLIPSISLTIWNRREAKFDLAGQSRKHGLSPKLSLRLFNMNFNNTYKIYMALMETYNSGRRPVSMLEGVKEATYYFLQKGSNTRRQVAEHPSPIMAMNNVHGSGCGRRKRLDAKDVVSVERTELSFCKLCRLKGQQKTNP